MNSIHVKPCTFNTIVFIVNIQETTRVDGYVDGVHVKHLCFLYLYFVYEYLQ